MRLEMFLSGSVNLNGFDNHGATYSDSLIPVLKATGLHEDLAGVVLARDRCLLARIDIGYWIDAFDIHRFFLDQHEPTDAEARIGEQRVPRAALRELAQRCFDVLRNESLYRELLPAPRGTPTRIRFEENDRKRLRHTVEVIRHALDLPIWWFFTYRSR